MFPKSKACVVLSPLQNYLLGDSYNKIRLSPVLTPKTSPAATCFVTILQKVLMGHNRDELFKVLTARCSLSTLGIIGYSEKFMTLP